MEGVRTVRRLITLGLAFIIGLSSFASSEASPASRSLVTHACSEGRSKVTAICGTFRVYENRQAHSGRVIDLGFVLLEAEHRSGRVIYFNPGGPGAATTAYAGQIADGKLVRPLSVLRANYDILLLDNRGMGLSHALDCSSIYDARNPAPYFLRLWPPAALRACRARVAKTSDLSQYNTDNAADDLNDLRAALGYRKVVLYGDSYGTYFSFIYMRRHPDTVESAVLNGVGPPRLLINPLEDARGAQWAMNDLISACEHDKACHARFPDLERHFTGLLRRFERGPLTIVTYNSVTHKSQRVRLSFEVFADRLRQMLYSEQDAAYVPIVIEDAYRGNYAPLGALINVMTLYFAQVLDTGSNLSYYCSEQVPFITPAMAARTSANTFQGDSRVRAEQEACRIWNVHSIPSSENAVVHSDLPVLMISGTDDPTSPAMYAQEELRYLPNARLVLQRGEGHTGTTRCTDYVTVRFVLAGSAKDLPALACAGSFHRPPFVLRLSPSDYE